MTPEIRRELLAAKCRDCETADPNVNEAMGVEEQELEYDPVFDGNHMDE